jgi:hypothetical protein
MMEKTADEVATRAAKRTKSALGDASADSIVAEARRGLQRLCDAAGIDDSHGMRHAAVVLSHAEAALAAATAPLAAERALAVRLAALLHDADDRKYFPHTAHTLANAHAIMRAAGAPERVAADAARMIGWVSCSKHGNACPAEACDEPELLWPRWADRLEAVGEVGVVRCYEYNRRAGGVPLATDATPRPRTAEEALEAATAERFAAYQASGGHSASMLDHYYDKLLQVARPPPALVRNRYLEEAALRGAAPLLRVCLAYGETGEAPVGLIEEMAQRLGLAVD